MREKGMTRREHAEEMFTGLGEIPKIVPDIDEKIEIARILGVIQDATLKEMAEAVEGWRARLVLEPCPVCDGDGCETCLDEGMVVTPSSLRAALVPINGQMAELNRKLVYFGNFLALMRWDTISETELRTAMAWHTGLSEKIVARPSLEALRELGKTAAERILTNSVESERDIESARATAALGAETLLSVLTKAQETTQLFVDHAVELQRKGQALRTKKKIASGGTTEPAPEREPENVTKAAGKMCWKPHCKRTTNLIVDVERNRAWCRRHAPQRLRRG